MITHCPSCDTHFRVRAEQLAARAGQVRCGKCSRVFNALEHLIDESAPAYAPRPIDEFAAVPGDAAVDFPVGSAVTDAVDFETEAAEHATAGVAEPGNDGREPAVAERIGAETDVSLSEATDPSSESAFEFGPVAAAGPAKRARRWPWLLGALLMLLTLLAQLAYYFRGAIVLLVPETKPYATALCAKMGCELPLPRRIDLMSIEASDLQADTTNTSVMVLTATIKNRAIFNQQHPFLELTLTDGQDQPVVRRVLAPQDYIGKGYNAQVGVGANSEIAIKVIIEGSQVKATGYRLYLFYP